MNIFIGNLSSNTTAKQLENIFTPFGEITSVKMITDTYTRRPNGVAFVEMPERRHAEKAIATLNKSVLHGQLLTINEAHTTTSGERFGRRYH